MTANAEIEVSRRHDVLRVANAALRFRPEDAAPATSLRTGAGFDQALPEIAAALALNEQQQDAFDAALAALEERIATRRAGLATASRGAGGPPMGPPGPTAGNASSRGSGNASGDEARQRMAENLRRSFAEFRSVLDAGQQQRWDADLDALTSARLGEIWKLVDGRPQAVRVRLGASDGTATEVGGAGVAAGDVVIVGQEREQG